MRQPFFLPVAVPIELLYDESLRQLDVVISSVQHVNIGGSVIST